MWASASPVALYSHRGPRRRPTKKDAPAATTEAGLSSPSAPDAGEASVAQVKGETKTKTTATSTATTDNNNHAISPELLEPAIDGPPSPERIRALSKQMKRASVLDTSVAGGSSTTTTTAVAAAASSSGSSSLRSHGSGRPSWEQTLETFSLSRRSSGRSTASSMPSNSAAAAARDRPESVQIFGKSLFGRRAKLKQNQQLLHPQQRRESGQQSSSSSLYSAELHVENGGSSAPTSATREHFLPSMFTRRRTLRLNSLTGGSRDGKDEPSPSSVPGSASSSTKTTPTTVSNIRKLQISGPYNFQHVTHTRRDQLPQLQRASRMELVSEFSIVRAAASQLTSTTGPGVLRGIRADDLHFADFSSEALPLQDDQSQQQPYYQGLSTPHSAPLQKHALAPGARVRPPIKHTRSHENLRASPPRPVRPDNMVTTGPPIPPPPRVSSRMSMLMDGGAGDVVYDSLDATPLQRPQTSGGLHGYFRHPQPFALTPSPERRPPATSHGLMPLRHASAAADAADEDAVSPTSDPFSSARSLPHAITTPDDAAWPLTASAVVMTFESNLLPDVPEEDEDRALAAGGAHGKLSRLSRQSFASNSSSLRRSQSVPLLRQSASLQHLQQREQYYSQRPPSGASDTLGRFDPLVRAAARAGPESSEALPRESWEDDVDYCYEHEAEANCDYAWDRPSFDVSRDMDKPEDTTLSAGAASGAAAAAAVAAREPRKLETPPVSDASPPLGGSGGLSTPGRFDVPALSPASQASNASTSSSAATVNCYYEAVTPTAPTMPPMVSGPGSQAGPLKICANFSLPGRTPDGVRSLQRDDDASPVKPTTLTTTTSHHQRTASHASSFKESHGFHLSPSLLIPGDFHHQMLLSQRQDAEPLTPVESNLVMDDDEEPTLTMDTSALITSSSSVSLAAVTAGARHSTASSSSTVGTGSDDGLNSQSLSMSSVSTRHHHYHNNSVGYKQGQHHRHISTTSSSAASTALTRLTMSTTSLNKIDSWVASGAPSVVAVSSIIASSDDDDVTDRPDHDDDDAAHEADDESVVVRSPVVVSPVTATTTPAISPTTVGHSNNGNGTSSSRHRHHHHHRTISSKASFSSLRSAATSFDTNPQAPGLSRAASIYHRTGRPLTRDLRSKSDADLLSVHAVAGAAGGRRPSAPTAVGSTIAMVRTAPTTPTIPQEEEHGADDAKLVAAEAIAAVVKAAAAASTATSCRDCEDKGCGREADNQSTTPTASTTDSAAAKDQQTPILFPVSAEVRREHRRHQSTKSLVSSSAAAAGASATTTKRQRARTQSSVPSDQHQGKPLTPPVGQYALFPSRYRS